MTIIYNNIHASYTLLNVFISDVGDSTKHILKSFIVLTMLKNFQVRQLQATKYVAFKSFNLQKK